MDILNSIQDKMIIICENSYKNTILKKMSAAHQFLDVKFFTKKEFLQEYLFKYDEKTVYYLVNKYNYKVEIAKMYLDNLIYVDGIYDNPKLQFLVDLKKELLQENLLYFNNNFYNAYQSYQFLIIGYPYLEPFELNIFNKFKVTYYKDKEINNIKEVYEFNNQEEEVNFVFKKISELINNNIPINKIKIVGINEDYYNDLERYSYYYNIPIILPSTNNLYSNPVSKKFLEYAKKSIEEGIEAIQNENPDIVKKIVNICNKYIFTNNLNTTLKLIIYDLKNIIIDNTKYQNYVEIKDINSLFDDEYVFFMNLNNGINPMIIKDEHYITDNIKENLNLFLTKDINKYNKEYLINKIKSICNLTISYKLNNKDGICYPSSIINELKLNVIKEKNKDLISYSYLNDLISYTKELDKYELYGEIDNNLYIHQNSIKDINYKSYDNRFKGIDVKKLKEYLHSKLTLSYSSLNNYNKCAFRYYLANILKLDKYEESFEAFIGSLFHDVLEKSFTYNLVVEEEVKDYIERKGKKLTIKERFFVNMVIDDIKFVIMVLNRQKNYTNLTNAYYERNIKIDKSKDLKIEFTGFVDKILYKENDNETIVAIIDYKTGSIDLELKYLPYGLSLQLPIYLYLVKKSDLFRNPLFSGFYLQNILDNDIKRDNNISYEEQKYNNLKLRGYSNSSIRLLKELDNTYQNSNLIKGLKINNDGNFSTYSKILNNEQIDNIINLTEQNIDKTINHIINGDFDINPKKIGYDNFIGCEYCRFQDICFKKEKDYVVLKDIPNLDFLGGENYAEVD